MGSMKVAVMGGGNGSHTIAADLTLKGLRVNMFELEQFAGNMRKVFETCEIEMTGVAGSGIARLNMVTSDIQPAVENVEIVFIPLPGFTAAVYAELLAPFLKKDQIVVLSVLEEFISLAKEHGFSNIITCTSAQEVIEGTDVIVTATGHLEERVYKEGWVKEGALILPVHTRGWEKSMLSKADKFIVDDFDQFNNAMGGSDGYYAPLPELCAQLGEIVVGHKPGRENPAERIVNLNFGMAIHDVLMATRVLERAREKGLGVTLPLIEKS